MELAVGSASVLLTTHKTYCEMEELRCLQAVSHYAPLLSYLSRCADRGAVPTAVVVRGLRRVAHRITAAEVDVVYDDAATHTTTAHVLRISNEQPALLLPTAVVEGRRCALLVTTSTLSQGLRPVAAALRGSVAADGSFAASTAKDAAAMERVGVSCAAAEAVTPQTFTLGNEGEAALRIFTVSVQWGSEATQALQSTPDVVLLPLEDVCSAGDAGAALAASLLL